MYPFLLYKARITQQYVTDGTQSCSGTDSDFLSDGRNSNSGNLSLCQNSALLCLNVCDVNASWRSELGQDMPSRYLAIRWTCN